MICPKCGEEYEDDMQCCLWCDAPNPNYGRVEEAERKVGSVQKRNQGEINGFDYLEHSDLWECSSVLVHFCFLRRCSLSKSRSLCGRYCL